MKSINNYFEECNESFRDQACGTNGAGNRIGISTANATAAYEFTNTAPAIYNGNLLTNTTGKFATASFTNVANMSNTVDTNLAVLPNAER